MVDREGSRIWEGSWSVADNVKEKHFDRDGIYAGAGNSL